MAFSCFSCGKKERASTAGPQTVSAQSSQQIVPVPLPLPLPSQQTVPLPSSQQTGLSQHIVPSPAAQQAPSFQETPPPSLNEVKDQLKAVNDAGNVDELMKIILDFLQWRTAGKSVEDKAESSESVAPLFIDSGAKIFRFLDDLVEKSSNKEKFVDYAPQIIIADVLEKLENVYWLVAGLSMIGSVLHTAETMSKNYERCLDTVKKLVILSYHVKKLDYRFQNQEVKLKRAIELIVSGCILCASQISSHKLFRFLKVFVNKAVFSHFDKQINDLCIDLIITSLEQGPDIYPQIPPAYPIDADEESKYVGEDVFLSHSGVQKNFVRQLHRDLTREGVSCFFDESRQCLPLAEKWAPLIFEAAETCRVAVLLLSMDFIQSTWPMLELSAFMKAKKSGKNSKMKILPLFFKISPSDLKDLTSHTQDIPYRIRPEISEKTRIEWTGISEETRNEWKEALREVRKINGLRFNEGGDEVSFRDEIIKEIRTLLPPPPIVSSMPVGSVGLAEGEEKVIELLQLTSTDTLRMALVIYGFGGIGKTTLAEAVVAKIDLKPYHYARVDFNLDTSRNDTKILQEQLLNGLFPGMETEFTSCSQGRTVLTKAFKNEGNKPIFLFIDNVLRKQDLEELLPRDMKGLPSSSRILVTTRDLGATDMFIEGEAGLKRQQYVVQPLSDKESKNFLLKGLADRQLEKIQEKDVERILNICKGVPLVLKIVRGHFRKQGYRAGKCSQILEALERGEEINQEDMGRTLTDFVYEQLEESSKQAFLDICCFFYGMDPSRVEYVVGAQELTSLEEAAFVQRFDDKKTLIVHDIIRERGRNKAESTRIMNVKSLIDAANEQRLKDIRGVWFKDEPECVVEEQHLKSMTKLRVLALGNRMRVTHRCEVIFKELRFLKVGGDIACLPVNLERHPKLAFYAGPLFKKGFSMYNLPEGLRVLIAARQSDFNESTCSEESTSIRAVKNSSLKELDISELKNLQKVPPGLHLITSLEILRWNGWNMKELPEGVYQLTMLTQLALSSWTSLTCLPAGFERLTALKDLDLSDCKALQCLPKSFGELAALEKLNLWSCTALESLPESFGELKALKKLGLRSCESLKRLPESFGELEAVETLSLSSCTALQCLPESLGEVKALKFLYLTSCQALERLPESFGQLAALETLSLASCTALECLPESFGELKALKFLYLTSCPALKRLPESFGQLVTVETLSLGSCTTLQCLPESLGELKALKFLDLKSCEALERLPESFGRLAAVKILSLRRCRALRSLPESFGELKALKDLDLVSCKALERLPVSFGELKALKELDLVSCTALERLPESFGQLKALKDLDLVSCKTLKRLPESFGQLAAVQKLKLRSCTALQCLPESFGELAAVETLSLSSCIALQCLPESLGELKALKFLYLTSCQALERLPESFGQLAALETLSLGSCTALQSLPESFGELKALKFLYLTSCQALERLPESFGQLVAVETLSLGSCTALQCLPESLGGLKALKFLDLKSCRSLERLPESFGRLAAVKILSLSCCTALQSLPESFGELKALKDLDLVSCKALKRLPKSFGQLAAVEKLKLRSCTALQCLPESFGELAALKYLDLVSCKALEGLPGSFGQLAVVEKLKLRSCTALQCLPESFGELAAFETLSLSSCTALQCLPESFGELKSLKDLDLSSCQALERLPESFGQLVALETLSLSRCTTLQCLPESLGELKAMKFLYLTSCQALERLPESFGQLAAVEELSLSKCITLQCLPESFGELKALKYLLLSWGNALHRLPESFGQLPALETLNLNGCTALQYLPASFGELKALQCLYLDSCKALERLPESFGDLVSLLYIKMADCPARADLCQFEANLKHVTIYEDKSIESD